MSEPENNAIVFNDNTVQPFTVPSCEQTGLKIIGPFEIEAGNTTSVLLDFDVRSSVVELGNGGLILKPAITVLDTLNSCSRKGLSSCVKKNKGFYPYTRFFNKMRYTIY